jgi:NAD(P)H-dependent flavin oxidoreductase YrpB (nitropropane dioxygenase family)
MICDLKASLSSPSLPFGVDLALPAVGGTARKTNHDYTKGLLSELIDVVIEEKTKLFVSAVGVPPRDIIERLHEGGVVVMNMVGHPRHAVKAFEAGVDIVCAQGGEGGGHTGEISMNLLVPACVDVAKKCRPKMLGGGPGMVVAAGGICDGRGLAGSLAMGAVGVWVGTR